MPQWIDILIAICVTLAAGMATSLGGAVTLFPKLRNHRLLAWLLGLSAGVMVYIAFVDLLPEATAMLNPDIPHGETEHIHDHAHAHSVNPLSLLSFLGGIILIGIIDLLIPSRHKHHTSLVGKPQHGNGTVLAVAVAIHNIPEGMATFVTALDNMELAVPILVAIAIHNLPLGMAIAVPVYNSTGSRRKAFMATLLTGLAEPLGAVAGMLFLLNFWTPAVNAVCIAAVAGIMVYIAFDELMPDSESHGFHHLSICGLVCGMALMGTALLLL